MTVRTGVRALRARASGRERRGARHRSRRRLDRRGPCRPARGRTVVPDRRSRPRALRHRHDRPDAVPARRAAAPRRRPVGHRRPGRTRAAHPPGALPGRDRGPDGPRRAGDARLPRPAPRDLHRARSVVGRADAPGGARPRSRRVRAGRRLRQEHAGLRARGQVGARDDRRRPPLAPAGRRRDGLPRRLGRHPRVRAGDQGAGPGRRPGRHDPGLPVDLADLQRPVRRCPQGAGHSRSSSPPRPGGCGGVRSRRRPAHP